MRKIPVNNPRSPKSAEDHSSLIVVCGIPSFGSLISLSGFIRITNGLLTPTVELDMEAVKVVV